MGLLTDLLGDGNATSGARQIAGLWYGSPAASVSTATAAAGRLYLTPFLVRRPFSVDRLRCEVTTAGDAGTTVRLGVYGPGTDGKPGAVVVDGGTVDGTVVATHDLTVAVSLSPGLYWLATLAEGGTPTMRCIATAADELTPSDGTVGVNTRAGLYGSATGAFSANPTISGPIGTPPRVFLRAA